MHNECTQPRRDQVTRLIATGYKMSRTMVTPGRVSLQCAYTVANFDPLPPESLARTHDETRRFQRTTYLVNCTLVFSFPVPRGHGLFFL